MGDRDMYKTKELECYNSMKLVQRDVAIYKYNICPPCSNEWLYK